MNVRLLRSGDQRPVTSYELAMAHTVLGDREAAFEQLEQAYRERQWRIVRMRGEWCLEPLRSDPRFDALARRIGLPGLSDAV